MLLIRKQLTLTLVDMHVAYSAFPSKDARGASAILVPPGRVGAPWVDQREWWPLFMKYLLQ